MKVKLNFAWYGFLIGFYFDRVNRKLLILPFPMIGIEIQRQARRKPSSREHVFEASYDPVHGEILECKNCGMTMPEGAAPSEPCWCLPGQCTYQEVYNGYQCTKCDHFLAESCAPWISEYVYDDLPF